MIPDDAWPQGDRLCWDDDATRTHWDFTTEPYGQRPYTAAENAEADNRAVTAAAEATRDALTDQAQSALVGNRTFLALAAPTNAQTLAQVKALTRQLNSIARLVVGDLTGTD